VASVNDLGVETPGGRHGTAVNQATDSSPGRVPELQIGASATGYGRRGQARRCLHPDGLSCAERKCQRQPFTRTRVLAAIEELGTVSTPPPDLGYRHSKIIGWSPRRHVFRPRVHPARR